MRRICGLRFRHLLTGFAGGLVLSFGLSFPVAAGPFEDGIAAYNADDFTSAMEIWRPLAAEGNPRAQYQVAALYAAGRGVRRDDEQVVSWLQLSAQQGFARAQSWLGFMYEFGERVAANQGEAISWYRRAAQQGDAFARDRLALIRAVTDEITKN